MTHNHQPTEPARYSTEQLKQMAERESWNYQHAMLAAPALARQCLDAEQRCDEAVARISDLENAISHRQQECVSCNHRPVNGDGYCGACTDMLWHLTNSAAPSSPASKRRR